MSTITQNLITIRTMSTAFCLAFLIALGGCKKDDGGSDGSDASDAADVTATTDPSDASDSTDSTDVTDSSDSTDETDPTDATDPSDETDPTDATDPADESDATDASDPSETGPVLGFKSVPAFSANVGEKFQYRPLLDQDGSAEWSLTAGPDSAAFNESGILVWEPAEGKLGPLYRI